MKNKFFVLSFKKKCLFHNKGSIYESSSAGLGRFILITELKQEGRESSVHVNVSV